MISLMAILGSSEFTCIPCNLVVDFFFIYLADAIWNWMYKDNVCNGMGSVIKQYERGGNVKGVE